MHRASTAFSGVERSSTTGAVAGGDAGAAGGATVTGAVIAAGVSGASVFCASVRVVNQPLTVRTDPTTATAAAVALRCERNIMRLICWATFTALPQALA